MLFIFFLAQLLPARITAPISQKNVKNQGNKIEGMEKMEKTEQI
jgi:hypothetical protein